MKKFKLTKEQAERAYELLDTEILHHIWYHVLYHAEHVENRIPAEVQDEYYESEEELLDIFDNELPVIGEHYVWLKQAMGCHLNAEEDEEIREWEEESGFSIEILS